MIAAAKTNSPLALLQKNYSNIEVSRRGDSISVHGVLRSDLVAGSWVSCDWASEPIGDNIALAQWIKPNSSFPDAVFELTGVQSQALTQVEQVQSRDKPAEIARPSIPVERARTLGRIYLNARRGISFETIDWAEKSGVLRYVENGVIFVGRDAAKAIRSAAIRHFEPVHSEDGRSFVKRDLANSDKNYPAVLKASLRHVVLVEGGINALAVRDMAIRDGVEPPSVISTGGVGVRKFVLENPAIKAQLQDAELVEIMAENELDEAGSPDLIKQAKINKLREKLLEAIAEIREGEIPTVIYPPSGIQDTADWNSDIQGRQGSHPRIKGR